MYELSIKYRICEKLKKKSNKCCSIRKLRKFIKRKISKMYQCAGLTVTPNLLVRKYAGAVRLCCAHAHCNARIPRSLQVLQ